MDMFQNLMERLRQLVGPKGWDYCVVWKLSDDQRFLEWMDCCCGGAENVENGGELQFPVTPALPCRDVMFQHLKTKSCELLLQLPFCIPVDSGNHAMALISNQPKWLNFSNNSDSNVLEDTVGTRILIPISAGLVELFVAKQVCEDQNVIDYVTTLCNISLEQGAMMTIVIDDDQKDPINLCQQPVSLGTTMETVNLPYDISVDRIRLSNSPTNSMQQYSYLSENKNKIDMYNVEGSSDVFLSDKVVNPYKSSGDNGLQEMDALNSIVTNNESMLNQGNDKDSIKQENGRSDSISDCSDQNDDEDDARCQRRAGSKGQSKNLVAERRRRKKLNERLYALRSLVPKISKLDRASILGDAIEFVKELQNQVKEFQDELEEHSDDDGTKRAGMNGVHKNVQSEIFSQNDFQLDPHMEHEKGPNAFHVGGNNDSVSKQNQEMEISSDKTQQMEVQVEVAQIDGNQFFVKVFSEHKPGGFVRLMEALDSLGLEVTNANVNSFRGLVSNVFKVEKKDCEMVQAEDVRESLLELTRNPSKGVSEMTKASENNHGIECNYHNQQHHLHNHHLSPHHHHHHHHHHLHHFQ
ncbi:hypothetical protein CCACVL1_16631 [Corchorus capsularis]|uniref:BHLH domain-containing protein n=1 Tax=Corchorus capsularis TaxID=210143 RepID=A0A1R3HW06_COCAP|nr:hypothetical protein CCACVL1_16631 [Corchorus capsularis]